MSNFATIFEKIKEDFFSNQMTEKERENYKFIFSPFSTGFTYDDFLFLDTNTASENAHKYRDELYEFSTIANTIPKDENFWEISGDGNDYLFNPYKTILENLRLLDVDTLNVDILYKHPIFLKALDIIDDTLSIPYLPFYKLYSRVINEIYQLQKSITDENRVVIDLQIKMKEGNLKEIKTQWVSQGQKENVEAKILEIIKDEFKRFLSCLNDIKAKLEMLHSEHNGSSYYETYCKPNNLYKSDELSWKKIKIEHSELNKLSKKLDLNSYKQVFGTSDIPNLELETVHFELLFTNVTRAWYDESILSSPFWSINILNKNEISIPRITSKLIFVRNVEIIPKKKSQSNKLILGKSTTNNIGPFMFNTAQLQLGKSLKLNSINKPLKVKRNTGRNISTKVKRNQKVNNKRLQLMNLIKTKTINFKKPISRNIKNNVRKSVKDRIIDHRGPRKKIIDHRKQKFKPILMVTHFSSFIKCEFSFTEKESNSLIPINKKQIKVFQKNKQVNIVFTQLSSNILSANFTKNSSYQLVIEIEGYNSLNIPFNSNPINPNAKVIKKNIPLNKEITEDFQLLGVISKKVAHFPNPIQGADYL